jgi:hypothetical protein
LKYFFSFIGKIHLKAYWITEQNKPKNMTDTLLALIDPEVVKTTSATIMKDFKWWANKHGLTALNMHQRIPKGRGTRMELFTHNLRQRQSAATKLLDSMMTSQKDIIAAFLSEIPLAGKSYISSEAANTGKRIYIGKMSPCGWWAAEGEPERGPLYFVLDAMLSTSCFTPSAKRNDLRHSLHTCPKLKKKWLVDGNTANISQEFAMVYACAMFILTTPKMRMVLTQDESWCAFGTSLMPEAPVVATAVAVVEVAEKTKAPEVAARKMQAVVRGGAARRMFKNMKQFVQNDDDVADCWEDL